MKIAPSPRKNRPLKADERSTCFKIKTRLARVIGTQRSRYQCDSVRVLPAPKKNHVVLQATDGKQAVCLVTPGNTSESALVPGSVLPTRQSQREVDIRFDRGDWRSSDGKLAQPVKNGQAFPPIGDVLPAVNGKGVPSAVTLGIDVSLLNRVAEAFGTPTLTLMIALPPKGAPHVNRAVAVCPADDQAGTRGIAVVMPLTPKHTAEYYMKVRKDVKVAEKRPRPRK